MSKQPLSIGFRTVRLTHTYLLPTDFCQHERKKKTRLQKGSCLECRGERHRASQHPGNTAAPPPVLSSCSPEPLISFLSYFFPLHLKVTISAGHWSPVREKDFTTLKEKTRAGKRSHYYMSGSLFGPVRSSLTAGGDFTFPDSSLP